MGRIGAVALAAGTVLGVVGRLSDGWPDTARLLFVLGAPWMLVAVMVGLITPGVRRGASTGALSLIASVVVYYVVMHFVEGTVTLAYALGMIAGWGSLAAVVGAVFGAAGTALRRGSPLARSAAAGLVGGGLAGEALFFLARGQTGEALVLLGGELLAGLAIATAIAPTRWRTRALGLTVAAAGMAFVVDAGARILMRRYGWGGI